MLSWPMKLQRASALGLLKMGRLNLKRAYAIVKPAKAPPRRTSIMDASQRTQAGVAVGSVPTACRGCCKGAAATDVRPTARMRANPTTAGRRLERFAGVPLPLIRRAILSRASSCLWERLRCDGDATSARPSRRSVVASPDFFWDRGDGGGFAEALPRAARLKHREISDKAFTETRAEAS